MLAIKNSIYEKKYALKNQPNSLVGSYKMIFLIIYTDVFITAKTFQQKQLSMKSQATPLSRHIREEENFPKSSTATTNESYSHNIVLALPSGTLF